MERNPVYSILIPYYDPHYEKTEMFTNLIKSIVENSKNASYELVIVKDGPSYTESHNRALRAAKGSFLVVLNDDLVIQDPDWLSKLTTNGIGGFRMDPFTLTDEKHPNFACWSMSRDVFEKIGYFDEGFKDGTGYEDNDYCFRAKQLGIPLIDCGVKLLHLESQTLGKIENRKERLERNKNYFRNKWKI